MSHGPGADFHAGGRSKFFQIVQAGFFAGVVHIVARAFRRAEVEKFVDVVHHAAIAQDAQTNDGAAERADGESVGSGNARHMIAHLPAAAAVHVLDEDGRIARDVFAQKRHHRLRTIIANASGSGAGDHGDGFSLIKWRLSETAIGRKCGKHGRCAQALI